MKRLFYFILLIAGLSSIHSCKEMIDEDGNSLIDLNPDSGLTGPRALFREVTDADTLAEYHYNGLLLTKVLTDSSSVTNIAYSGDKISKIDFMGFLDLDGDDKLDKDSISYSQLFTYGPTGKLVTISENRSFFKRTPPVAPSTTPGPQTLYKKTKSLYTLKYSATTDKLESIGMQNGPDASGTPFVFTDYSDTKYEYQGDNVSKVTREYGPVGGGVVTKYGYDYYSYDTQISPFTLLPFGYKISRLLSTESNDVESFILSPNSPKRISITDLMTPIPSPVFLTTDYLYDPQTYMRVGFGINYIYKPL
ncbi:hypothetical protein [Chryseobacterium sp.]|uniref:hypothetical protein n=1 Tax=Chryseobacterium sp. TaxID=1871047 RepID=UPI00289A22E3|nr:hypothetical protein [Chryseobacterium sp.]